MGFFSVAVALIALLQLVAAPEPTAAPRVPSPLLHQQGGVNHGLHSSVAIKGNTMDGEAVETVAQLQRVLDSHPGTVIHVSSSSFTIGKIDPQPIRLHSNRSLVMDAATTILCDGVVMPPTDPMPPQNVSGYGGVVVMSGSNIALSGGRIEQTALDLVCKYGPDRDTGGSCNFGVDVFDASDAKVTGVTIRGSFSDAIRVFNSQGNARGKPVADTFGAAALDALTRRPVVLAHNTLINPHPHGNCSTCSVQPRGIWLIVSAGVIVSSNTVVGPWLYGIDMDSEASFCTVTNNTVTDSLYSSIFVEMQCTGNMITANTVRQTGANPHETCAGIHVDSYLNSVIANDFGDSGMCVSGLAQGQVYPPALANRFVDNVSPVLDLGSSGRDGCGNYASENKAANGSYALVEDFFTAVNGEHKIPFDRSVCIDPNSTDNDADNWAIVSDTTTALVVKMDDDDVEILSEKTGAGLASIDGDSPLLDWQGRVDRSVMGRVSFDWVGTSVAMRLKGASVLRATFDCALKLPNAGKIRIFLHDDNDHGTTGKPQTYPWPASEHHLPTGNTTVVLAAGAGLMRTAVVTLFQNNNHEGSVGSQSISLVALETDGVFLPAVKPAKLLPKQRRITFIGDSITAATNNRRPYGDLSINGADGPIQFLGGAPTCADWTGLQGDYSLTYQATLCRNISNSNCTTVAVGGKGMYRNCCDPGPLWMPQ